MMIAGALPHSARWIASHARSTQRAGLHLGRATAAGTQALLEQAEVPQATSLKLRLSDASHAFISHRGIGSPNLWAKDIPRIDASKNAIASHRSNFIQASINPYASDKNTDDKQAYVESLVIQEAIEDDEIPREGLIISALLAPSMLTRVSEDPIARLSEKYITSGVQTALSELGIETLDHVVLQIPEELLVSGKYTGKATDTLLRAAESLETLCSSRTIQSYGFALPHLASSTAPLDRFIESTLLPVSEQHKGFASLQLSLHPLSDGAVSSTLREFQKSRDILLIADKVFDATLSNGKPLLLRTYAGHMGEDIALVLKTAFNLAMSIERKYMEHILPANSTRQLPTAEQVAWAHILANQHSQFDNLEEWLYIRESQILPRFEETIKQFDAHEDLKEFGFAYTMALRELLKCFTASIELVDASRAENILAAFKDNGLVSMEGESLEQVAVKAALSAGADVVLFQEQLGKHGDIASDALFTPAQLDHLKDLARPFLVVE